jgi:hypothetical protein
MHSLFSTLFTKQDPIHIYRNAFPFSQTTRSNTLSIKTETIGECSKGVGIEAKARKLSVYGSVGVLAAESIE